MSEGMLTGRLWIADLHRLLGEEEPAADIEAGLLRHDLLPMSRVPSALKAVAAKEGQAQADAIAYRVASYSNHPEVLPLALRHAREQGLKEPGPRPRRTPAQGQHPVPAPREPPAADSVDRNAR